jgi:hypothetical protein
MTTITVEELTAAEFAEHPLADDHIVACQANLTHEPSHYVGICERDHETQMRSVNYYNTAWVVTVRNGRQLMVCEDCVGALEDHERNLGVPDEALATVRFELVTVRPFAGVPACEANVQHNQGHGGGGEFVVDYGHIRPREKRVCGHCLESVLDDLRVMGWPTTVEHTVEAIMEAHQ